MWFLSRLAEDPAVYNLPSAVRLRGPLDTDALCSAFEAIVARHEILRTAFPAAGALPRQHVLSNLPLPYEFVDCTAVPDETREARVRELARLAFRRPFDLTNGPLFRLVLFRLAEHDHVLLAVFHHLVWDGWSIGIFVTELAAHYEAARRGEAADLPALPVQYADFALWERERPEEHLEARVAHWREALKGHAPLSLPTDVERPAIQAYLGASHPFRLQPDTAVRLMEAARNADTTGYRTLLAGFAAVLGRWAGQDRFVLGTPVANRHQREVAGLIGYFANPLPVPVDLTGNPTFAELLERTKAATTSAFAHQDVPFETLVERLGAGGDASRNPIFQVMFAVHQESLDTAVLGDMRVEPFFLVSDATHFDLALHLWLRDGTVQGYFTYSTSLFTPATIARLEARFVTLLDAALGSPHTPLASLPIMDGAEQSWLTSRQQGLPATGGSALALLEVRVESDPDARVGAGPEATTLADVRRVAAELAQAIASRQLVGTRIGITAQAPRAQLQAVWGAWLAGAVPVWLSADAAPEGAALLERAGLAATVDDALTIHARPAADGAGATPSAAAVDAGWVSHGTDAGVEVSSGDLAARIERLQARMRLGPSDAVCRIGHGAPDSALVDVLWPLRDGARLAADPEDATVLHATPRALREFLASDPARPMRLHTVICRGGYLDAGLAQAARTRLGCEVVYLYAPPESPCEVAMERVGSSRGLRGLVPAGTPMTGLQLLDEARQLVPIGATGRVWVGGCATADRARWREDGTLELIGPASGMFWRDGVRESLDRIAEALRADASVHACHVIQRGDDLCAFVVTSGMAPAARIARALALSPRRQPRVLPVSHIPRQADGRVDEASLLALPIIDDELARRWERALKSQAGVEHARVVVRDAELGPQERRHLDELVPGWRRTRTADRTSSRSAAAEVPALGEAGLPSSHCRGPALHVPPDSPETLVEALRRAAERWQDTRGLTVYETATDKTYISYAQLLTRARRVAAGLTASGLRRGDRVVLQVERLAEHFVAFWGCVVAGVSPVAVALAPSYREKHAVLSKLWNVWQLLGAPRILASASMCASLRDAAAVYDAAFEPIALESLEAEGQLRGDAPLEAQPDDVVFLQLTSGSTGVPKCVPETHRAVIAHVHGARQMNGYTEDDVGLNWLSLDHVVPLLTCHLKDTYLGLAQVHVRGQAVLVNPLLWLDLIAEHRVTLSWAPNFGFKLVNDALARAGARTWDLRSLRHVMNAGEQVTMPVSAAWVRNLAPFGVRPDVLQPAYGMAEVATAVTYANDFSPSGGAHIVRKDSLGGILVDAAEAGREAIAFVDVGPPIPGVELRITGAAGEVLPESVIGQVQVRGAVTMPGYVDHPVANAETLLADGWLATGDLGFVRGGRLTVTGRTKEIIIVRGANFYCYEVEEVVNNVPGVVPTFSAVCAVDDPMTGTEGMAVFFVPEQATKRPDHALLQEVQQAVTREFGITPTYVIPLAKAAFPKTTGGKIQRSQLKSRLAAGEFDALLRQIDLHSGRNTVPAWFLQWGWQRAPEPPTSDDAGPVLVVACGGSDDGASVRAGTRGGAALVEALSHRPVVLVETTSDATAPSPGRRRVNLEGPGDLDAVLDAVPRGSHRFSAVVVLDPTPVELLTLGKALVTRGNCRLLIGTTGALQVEANEAPCAHRAALRGLAEVVPVEWRGIESRLVDLTGEGDAAAHLAAELRVATKDRIVAYRRGVRLVPQLMHATFGDRDAARTIDEGDLVLVTGGLGGIGGEVSRHLLVQYRARLLVTGRSSLDAVEGYTGNEGLGRLKDLAERRETLRELEALGEVIYCVADATDPTQMAAAVAAAEGRFGTRLRAAVHLAGVFPVRLLAEETGHTLMRTIAPKLDGARVIDALLPPDGMLVLFGSVYATFGAAACGAYAAANAALEGYAAARPGPTRVMAWSNWDDIGMSRGYTLGESSRALGFEMMGRRQCLDAFDAALHARARSVLIGLDARRPNISRYLSGPPRGLLELLAYHTAPADPAALAALRIPDPAGQPTDCHRFPVEVMPLDERGAVDMSRLALVCRSSSADAILPRNAAERTVAAIWRDVLEIERIDIDANFFSLGGQSLLLLRVLARLEQSFGRQITVVDLFRHPTVRTLAAFLGEGETRRLNLEDASSRARKQRAVRFAPSRSRGGS